MAKFSIGSSMGLSLIISLGVLGFGAYNFLSQWAYSEPGHEYLLIGYIGVSILFFLLLRLSKIGFAVFLIVILAGITLYSNAKFDWRKSYILAAEGGKFFPMEQYIDAYPSFEEQKFGWFSESPRWVDFSKQCYEPMLAVRNNIDMRDLGRHCKTAALIKDFYRVDVRSIINNHYSKMQNTAKQLEKGRFKDKKRLESCIEDKKCALIPLLPAGVEIEEKSKEFLDIRRQFWSLINDKKMSPENCNFFDFCRVMVANDVIQFDKL